MPFLNVNTSGRRVSTGGGTDPGDGGTPGDGQGVKPYIGVADWNAPRTGATILALRQAQRGPNADRTTPVFNVDAEGNDGFWYAYPKIYGLATFNECDANGTITGIGEGGWDGAKGDPLSYSGPVEVNITIDGVSIPFYIYVSDWPGLGQMYWKVT